MKKNIKKIKTQQNKTRFRDLNPKPAKTFSPG
jgi:hypothetical protein